MEAIKFEYLHPTQPYQGANKFPVLWAERNQMVATLPDIVKFDIHLQHQIAGPRGYINSSDSGYNLFRKLALPLTSYITIMRLHTPGGKGLFYWKLFVDFEAIQQRQSDPLVFTYGQNTSKIQTITQEDDLFTRAAKRAEQKATSEDSSSQQASAAAQKEQRSRDAAKQAKYRAELLDDCPFCPITLIADERLLIASHIKPFAVCEESEEYDHNNGYMLSPLYDRLFDQGFITFTNDRKMNVSSWLTPRTRDLCSLQSGKFYQKLPMNEKRMEYLDYHRRCVFKG
jgi:hypothetical protein